jgi:hypothetical protein
VINIIKVSIWDDLHHHWKKYSSKTNYDFGALNSNHDSHLVDDLGHYI